MTTKVHSQLCGNTVHPSSRRIVSAGGTRLRRRLSRSFHCESTDSGFGRRRGPGPGTCDKPPRELPVAANPAMPAAHVCGVGRWIFLVQLDVAQEPRTRVATFDQVVAQDPVVGKAAVQCAFECVDIVDALADERAFAERVLVDVGHGARIRIDPRVAAMQARVPRRSPGRLTSTRSGIA